MSTFLPRRLQRIAHILLCFLLLFFSGCLPPTQSSQSDRKATSFKKDQLVVRYNSKLSSRLRDSVRNVLFGKYKITKIERCVCDSTLELIYASGIEWHLDSTLKGNSTTGGVDSSMKGNTSTGGVDSTRGNSSRDGVSVVGGLDSVTGNRSRGGVDSMYRVIYSRNFLLDRVIPGSKRMEKNVPAEYGGQKSKKVRIAVIDTGLDTLSAFTEASYFKFLLPASQVAYQEVGISWVPTNATSRYFGWNFIQNNQNIMDDHSFQHGTNVTGLILGQNPDYAPEIIPLKAVNAQGNFEMFHVLCALRFAERAQVNLVNTSWGYFGAPNIAMTDVLQSLSSKGIAVIASAGNEGIEIGGVDSYYPACYSNDQSGLKNVIAVTTAKQGAVCHHNYSVRYVDIGVSGTKSDCVFLSFFQEIPSVPLWIEGSSYATAILTGQLGNQYSGIGSGILKEHLLSTVHSPGGDPPIDRVRTHRRVIQQ